MYSTSYNTEGYHYFNVEESISTFNAAEENVSVYESKSDGSGINDYVSSMICDITPNGTSGTPLFCWSGTVGQSYSVSGLSQFTDTVTLAVTSNVINFPFNFNTPFP